MKLFPGILVFMTCSLIFAARGLSLLPPTQKEVVSEDGAYKAIVTPPRFEDPTSYEFFQDQNFLAIGALEGENRSRDASVRIAIYRLSNGKPQLVWARPASGTLIPRRVFMVGTNRIPLLVFEGRYGEGRRTPIPFSAYTSDGVCLTNSNLGLLSTNEDELPRSPWIYDGTNLVRLTGNGRIAAKLKVPQAKKIP